MNFKKLTKPDGSMAYVNLELATEITRTKKGDVTRINFNQYKNSLILVFVKETPEEIFQLPDVYNVQY